MNLMNRILAQKEFAENEGGVLLEKLPFSGF